MRAAKRKALPGNSKAERAALTWRGVDADLPAVALHRALRQVETVARTSATRLVQFEPQIENLGRVSRIDSDSVVANAEAVPVSVLSTLDGDRPLALRAVVEEERVGDQRADRFAHLLRIDVDGRQLRRQIDVHVAV